MGHFIDLTGQKFGRLTVLKVAYKDKQGCHWECVCDCGNKTIVKGICLRKGITISCGCYQKETVKKYNTKHGLYKKRIYQNYRCMFNRCYNISHRSYKDYGMRGIIICKEWIDDPVAFYNWSMANGYSDGLTIDRIDVNGNYEPSNCRWVCNREQQFNKRNTLFIEYKNEKRCLAEWCLILNIDYNKTYHRIKYSKWTVENAFEK